MKYLFAFSVKRELAPCQPWPLESAATGFRPLWRMCDPRLPPMSLGNTQRINTLHTGRYNNYFSHFFFFILIPLSSSPSLSFLSLPPSTGIFNLLPGKTSLWNYPFWSPGWSACVLNISPTSNSDVIAQQCQPQRVCHPTLCHVIVE